ncbi:prephenate dehydrogenase dimerization domain-containing protein, partial [Dubosiella newyorkensis]|uniref:prephenate dehydrogenase dimerization domain-containing protein n=1 Tax=Dubosiella newyorkensis TaxID=1862672 RepID=UPI0025B74833
VALAIGAIPLVLDCKEHDYSVAAVSHLPHLIASSLVTLVRDHDSKEEIMKIMEPKNFVGRAPQQTEEFFKDYIDPVLEANRDDLGLQAEINI